MRGFARRLLSDESGQGAVEYALVVAFVVIGLVAAAYAMVPTIEEGMDKLANRIKDMLSGEGGGGDSGYNVEAPD